MHAAANILAYSQSELIRSHVAYVIKSVIKGHRKRLDEDFKGVVDWLNRCNVQIYGYAED